MKCCSVAVIIITFNEEVNLPNALDSVIKWADQVFVIDSFSTDHTVEIAKSYGAEVCQNPFKSVGEQRNWALNNLPIKGEWVFFLDGDEYLSEEIKQEISLTLRSVSEDMNGFLTKIRFEFLGRWLKHGGLYENLIRMIRKGKGLYIETSGWHEKMVVNGKVGRLGSYIIHDDQKSLKEWVVKQSERIWNDANERLNEQKGTGKSIPSDKKEAITIEGGRSRWLRNMVFLRLPAKWRPFSQFFYRYILRIGFLDGWQGFIFHILFQFWYPLMVEAMCLQLKQKKITKDI